MKITTITNGSMKLVLSSESELEKQILSELFKGPVEVQIMDKLQILDKNIVDAVIISPCAPTGVKSIAP